MTTGVPIVVCWQQVWLARVTTSVHRQGNKLARSWWATVCKTFRPSYEPKQKITCNTLGDWGDHLSGLLVWSWKPQIISYHSQQIEEKFSWFVCYICPSIRIHDCMFEWFPKFCQFLLSRLPLSGIWCTNLLFSEPLTSEFIIHKQDPPAFKLMGSKLREIKLMMLQLTILVATDKLTFNWSTGTRGAWRGHPGFQFVIPSYLHAVGGLMQYFISSQSCFSDIRIHFVCSLTINKYQACLNIK